MINIRRRVSAEKKLAVTGSYVINQVSATAAPANRIKIDTPAMNSDDEHSVIHRIHSETKLYAAAPSSQFDGNSRLKVKEVSKSDKTLYADGTSVPSDYDVFMKLPEFWWKCEETSTNKWEISFSMAEKSGWNHWEGDTFIGCYEAYNNSSKVYSRRSVTPTVSVSQSNFKSYARSRGTGYQIVTWEAHCMMALLGYGWLGTTDDQSVVGYGSSTYPKTTGLCDGLGMTDTTTSNGGATAGGTNNGVSTNFWGLENWWGDLGEWIDNIKTTDSSGTIAVMNYAGTTVRTVQATTSSGCIGRMVIGQYGDMLPSEVHSNSSYNNGFAATGAVFASSDHVAYRSYNGSNAHGGLGYLYVSFYASSSVSNVGSRLLYKGTWIEKNSI